MSWTLRSGIGAAAAALTLMATNTAGTAANPPVRYAGGGWTLTIQAGAAKYGEVLSGSLARPGKSYIMHGDQLVTADGNGAILRFYGRAFGARGPKGLVGIAFFANTCNPNCASSRQVVLSELPGKNIPGLGPDLPGVNKVALYMKLK